MTDRKAIPVEFHFEGRAGAFVIKVPAEAPLPEEHYAVAILAEIRDQLQTIRQPERPQDHVVGGS